MELVKGKNFDGLISPFSSRCKVGVMRVVSVTAFHAIVPGFNPTVLTHLNVRLYYPNTRLFRAFNALFSKIGRAASDDVVLALVRKNAYQYSHIQLKHVPYHLSRDKHSIDVAITIGFL